jgi:hypothetical protein
MNAKKTSRGYAVLTINLELRLGAPRPAGIVLLANAGSKDIRVWQSGNQWGDTVLSFEILQGETVWRVFRRQQDYTRNVPSSVVVPPGKRHVLIFDLDDGDWDAGAPIERLATPPAQLVAVYDVPLSPEAIDHGVWTGQLRSNSVPLGE